ncbi:MAG TPA: lasso peptide biosynthesis B2 protein [Trueperaceae bacterium]|nr:lasso peptide biosynthesis B2 protein [Trueperaceae bacterium]
MMVRSAQAETYRRHLTDLVVRGRVTADAIDDVVAAGLAGLAIDRLQEDMGQPGSAADTLLRDPRLRAGRTVAAARHATVRGLVAELFKQWLAEGIEVLLVKGFYLAEFVYPEPSWRRYSDVDAALRDLRQRSDEELAAVAAAIASRLGWEVVWRHGEESTVTSHHDEDYHGHELLLLRHAETGVAFDAHRRLVHSNVPTRSRVEKGEAITEVLWATSTASDLAGASVRLPAPVDAALIGLITARSWSGDRYDLRPHDLLDLAALMKLGNFGPEELLVRAGELDVTMTTRLFLRRCDPTRGVFDLRPPSALEVLWYDTMLLAERGHRGLEKWVASVGNLPRRLAATLRELPFVVRQLRGWREHGEAGLTFNRVRVEPRALDRRSWRLRQLAVRRALQLLGAPPRRHAVLALHCLHDSLLRYGHDVRRRSADGRTWLEYSGTALSLRLLGVEETTSPSTTATSPPGRLSRIGWQGLRLRLEALFYLRRVVKRLRERPFRSAREELLRVDGDAERSPNSGVGGGLDPRAVGRAVESAARFVPGAQCVAQSLTAQLMLARRATNSTIHFGFLRRKPGAVEGHAWLEAAGEVVTGDVGLDNFTRTATFASTFEP